MIKRAMDMVGAAIGLVALAPIMVIVSIAIWSLDGHSPLYCPLRVGRRGRRFRMNKFRSMTADADRTGVHSTSLDDPRLTTIGRIIRTWKIDELPQLWNILLGDMSFVGPRPQHPLEVELYTSEELGMLSVLPGITDVSSIVFADLQEILQGCSDANLAYSQYIRPWKSRLSLLYVERRTFWIDVQLILLTVAAIISRPIALRRIQHILEHWGADDLLCRMAARQEPLLAYPPPGSEVLVTSYPR